MHNVEHVSANVWGNRFPSPFLAAHPLRRLLPGPQPGRRAGGVAAAAGAADLQVGGGVGSSTEEWEREGGRVPAVGPRASPLQPSAVPAFQLPPARPQAYRTLTPDLGTGTRLPGVHPSWWPCALPTQLPAPMPIPTPQRPAHSMLEIVRHFGFPDSTSLSAGPTQSTSASFPLCG